MLLPLFGCIILGLALQGGFPVAWLSTRPLVFLGNASYAMYILHAPLEQWLMILFTRVLHTEPAGPLWMCVYLVLMVAGSGLFYAVIEEPLHKWLRAKLQGKAVQNKYAA